MASPPSVRFAQTLTGWNAVASFGESYSQAYGATPEAAARELARCLDLWLPASCRVPGGEGFHLSEHAKVRRYGCTARLGARIARRLRTGRFNGSEVLA